MQVIQIDPPQPNDLSYLELEREEPVPGFYTIGNNWMQQNELGLYELYLEGEPFERGVIYGKLAKEQVIQQEVYFVEQIDQLVPSPFYQRFLKYLIGWFNRDLDEQIDEENLLEIYGVSRSVTDEYDFIGPKYQRILNYHAAHDIGHALADRNMVVGCTSFGAWLQASDDSSLILGRNFDFYVGDSFARDKIIMFMRPDQGHPFMIVTWGGFTGAVSGMNMEGLTVTINAAKSDYPTKAATPISLVARNILQYAGNIDEAYAIAGKYETFVSESILIGSANDGRAAIIEKTPTQTILYQNTNDKIVCSNHFQAKAFQSDSLNITHKLGSSSAYRYERMQELMEHFTPLAPQEVANILRDHRGKNNTNIGLGNEDAINQLLAHHSIIFKPEERIVWVSANPVPYNAFVAYDLNKVFGQYADITSPQAIDEVELRIAADTFYTKGHYEQYLEYKTLRAEIKAAITEKKEIEASYLDKFKRLNPEYYETYELLGDYYQRRSDHVKAIEHYTIALQKDIPLVSSKEAIEEKTKKIIPL